MTRLRRHNGLWKDAERYRKHNGVWKPISERFRRVGGVWQQTYSSGKLPADLPIGTPVDGGYFMGSIVDSGQSYGLIVSLKAQGDTSLTWGPSGVTGANSHTDGLGNTQVLVGLAGSYPAAQYCAGLNISGLSGWYLPSIQEMNVMFANRLSIPDAERLDNDWYWTSTEATAANATLIGFGAGSASQGVKTGARRLRAIRRIRITNT